MSAQTEKRGSSSIMAINGQDIEMAFGLPRLQIIDDNHFTPEAFLYNPSTTGFFDSLLIIHRNAPATEPSLCGRRIISI